MANCTSRKPAAKTGTFIALTAARGVVIRFRGSALQDYRAKNVAAGNQ